VTHFFSIHFRWI